MAAGALVPDYAYPIQTSQHFQLIEFHTWWFTKEGKKLLKRSISVHNRGSTLTTKMMNSSINSKKVLKKSKIGLIGNQ